MKPKVTNKCFLKIWLFLQYIKLHFINVEHLFDWLILNKENNAPWKQVEHLSRQLIPHNQTSERNMDESIMIERTKLNTQEGGILEDCLIAIN